MSSSASPHTLASQGKRTSFSSAFPGSNAPHLLDRSRAALRGSTPDSEALASSDDESDQKNRLTQVTSNPAHKSSIRRTSWLNEDRQSSNRKGSLGANGPFSPISPGTAAIPIDQLPWGSSAGTSSNSTLGRGHSSSASFPWSNNIWNSDSPKGPPQRLTEVLPSPTTMVPPGSAGLYGDESLTSPRDRESSMDPGIPFAIPLQPTPKTYRSQSYSVGQLDTDAINTPPATYGGHSAYVRPRMGTSYAGLQHRPSRPSMLVSHDSQSLGQLQEVEDDEESLDLSDSGLQQPMDPARTIEQLTRENALLREAAAKSKIVANMSQPLVPQPRQRSHDAVSDDSDHAVYEADEIDSQRILRNEGNNGRRFSEYGTKSGLQYSFAGIPENRTVESVKKGHWQSSLGFGGVVEPPQSRRHSFAEVPTRQNSVGSGGDAPAVNDTGDHSVHMNGRHGSPGGYGDVLARPSQGDGGEYALFLSTRQSQEQALKLRYLHDRARAVSYFSRMDPPMRSSDEYGPQSSTNLHQAYLQGQYGRPQQLGQSQHRPKQLLYIVTFKCQRADVFYVQEGTGLQVNKGDLVIVEADRGTDLGTVATDVVPWAEAKESKDKFIEDHHKWLMMFSQHGQNGTVAGQNPNGQPNTAVIGNSSGQHGMHDLPGGELKPKMIKRVAQQHEIQSLREKEGAEAKAKRACQQKVVEHRLRMEILDAEFQMDWKKLTFFYFADSYINFNPLVTDLFKIYKTRIWMSAINTAAIASPAGVQNLLGAQAHRNYSPETDDYTHHRQARQPQDGPSIGSSQPALGDQMWASGRDLGSLGAIPFSQVYAQQFQQGPGFDIRQMSQYPMAQYGQLSATMPGVFSGGVHALNKAPSFTSQVDTRNTNNRDRQESGRDWNQAFQGLSLGQ